MSHVLEPRMSGDVINLRRARKAKARADDERAAAESRRRFGRTKLDKATDSDRKDRAEKHMAGHRRERDGDKP
jgi:hypothetical protein